MRRLVLAVCLAAGCGNGAAAEIGGRLSLSAAGRALRADEAREAVVYFRPDRRKTAAAAGEVFEMQTRGKQFQPQTLVVPVGATVRFPNNDPILHNVFSSGAQSRFDLGLYGNGEGRAHTFERAGLVRVYCNVHHNMVGHILVLDTPYVSRPDHQGRYALDLPADTPGELFVWHARAPLWRKRIAVDDETAVLDVSIQLNRPLIPPHKNKFGKSYQRGPDHGY